MKKTWMNVVMNESRYLPRYMARETNDLLLRKKICSSLGKYINSNKIIL